MTYAATNPPVLVSGNNGPTGPQHWIYVSEDVHTDVDAANYFSNGHALGMRVNDVVTVVKSTATIGATTHAVTAVIAGGAATISPAILS